MVSSRLVSFISLNRKYHIEGSKVTTNKKINDISLQDLDETFDYGNHKLANI